MPPYAKGGFDLCGAAVDGKRVAHIATIKEDLLSKPAVFRASGTVKGIAVCFVTLFALMLAGFAWRHFASGWSFDGAALAMAVGFECFSLLVYVCLVQYKLTIADGWISTQYLWITRRTKTDDILKWNFGGKYNGQAYVIELKNGKTINIPGIQDRPRDFERILHAIATGRSSS